MEKIKLNQLEVLVAVANNGSFSAAAIALDCTQSRVSHAIAELESVLGARLFTRTRIGCAPTEAGQKVLHGARQMLLLAEDLASSVSDATKIAGHVRLACFRSVGTHIVPYVLDALERAHPGIQVDLVDECVDADEVAKKVDAGTAEIGIGCLPVGNHLLSYTLFSDDYVLMVPETCKLRKLNSWSQLNELPFIQPSNSRSFFAFEQCRLDGLTSKPARKMVSDSSIVAMVSHGKGFSILPRLATYPVPKGVDILELPIRLKREFVAIAEPHTARLIAVKTVMEFFRNKRILKGTSALREGAIQFL